MDNIEKTLRYNDLLNIYQGLLTETQKDILLEYFVYDLSLSEIADNRKISRAAVEDAIKKGMKKLDSFEDSLKILEKRQKLAKNTAKLKQNLENKEKIIEIITDIEKENL